MSKARPISSDDAAALVEPGMWLDYGLALSQPDVFDRALALRKSELSNVKIRSCITMKPRAVVECDPEGAHFHWFSWHFSGYDRAKHDAGLCNYMPVNLSEVPDYYRRFLAQAGVAVLKARPADADGFFNFGPTNGWHRALIESAKTVVVELSNTLPHAHGEQNGIHVSEVDYVIDGDHELTAELPNVEPKDVDRAVARHIAAQVGDGSCLQIGIGGMPNAVCSLLFESGARDLGVHTEMLTQGIVDLYKAGRLTGAKKTLHPGKLVYTFALGTKDMYAAIDNNKDFLCCPVEFTNSPRNIVRNDNVIAINNTTQVDLQGQAASESDGHRHISGTGGQAQFVRSAYDSNGGKSFICLASTYEKHGQRRSRIVFDLTAGNVVTTTRSDMMYLVTEYGMVCLKGKSVAERARAMISLAHPDFREDLERQAFEHRLIPRAVSFR